MRKNILIAPSILSADFSRLREEIRKAEDAGADMLHVDVMDGCFVPNITIGPLIVNAARRCTDLPLDVHLMIKAPHRFIKDFADAGSDIITIHAEAYGPVPEERRLKPEKGRSKTVNKINEGRVIEVLGQITSLGKKAGISLNPDSPFCLSGVLDKAQMVLVMSVHPGFGGQQFIPESLLKIKEARKCFKGDIEVDGGINDRNVRSVIEAGANIIVAGSYFFGADDPKDALSRLRNC